jgi:hypothetical protein
MFACNQFELFPTLTFPGLAPAFVSIRIHPSRFHLAPTTPSFSKVSALFQKSAHLIEKTLHQIFCFQTHAHSSPAFPLITVSCTKHTGGYTPSAYCKPKTLLEVCQLSPMSLNIYNGEIGDGGLKASATKDSAKAKNIWGG